MFWVTIKYKYHVISWDIIWAYPVLKSIFAYFLTPSPISYSLLKLIQICRQICNKIWLSTRYVNLLKCSNIEMICISFMFSWYYVPISNEVWPIIPEMCQLRGCPKNVLPSTPLISNEPCTLYIVQWPIDGPYIKLDEYPT